MDLITIDQITRTLTELDGSERIVGRDSTGDFKITFDNAVKNILNALIPSGVSLPMETSYSTFIGSSFTLSEYFAWCDGSVVSDAESQYNGYRTPNYNQGTFDLDLTWTADAGGSYALVDDVDIYALNVGDIVSGTGIAAGTLIKAITKTSGNLSEVTITDTAASGTKTTTFTGKKRVLIGGSGSGESGWNQMQGHIHAYSTGSGTALAGGAYMGQNVGVVNGSPYMGAGNPFTDGTNGTPRIGADTIPDHNVVKYAMRIK